MRISGFTYHRLRSALTAATLFTAAFLPFASQAQLARRLAVPPSSSDPKVELPDSLSPRVRHASVLGHLAGETPLTGMSLILKPTDAQNAELAQLLADQQNPSSPQYHQWLTPESFGARFGLADADIAVVEDWLTTHGFTVDAVAPSRNRIVFSGTASAVEAAFGTSMQRFHTASQDFFENGTELTLPSGLAAVVNGVTGLSSYRMKPPVHSPQAISPQWTGSVNGVSGYHFLVPYDFRQIFSINTLINASYNGTGVTIGVIGQSSVSTNQLTYFQQKTSATVKLPTQTLVPNTGASGQYSTGDEGESELDLEYASGSAPGATVQFIYTGLGQNNGVFDALVYAIQNKLTAQNTVIPILTLSYGGCEADDASYATSVLEPILSQASSQGQTVIASSGDDGPASCEADTNNTTTAAGGLSVSYPASSPNVTAVGGTQLAPVDPDTSGQYWLTSNNSYGGSAIGYMPETSWNDTASYGSLSASGGGYSTLFGKPSWQTGTGVVADGHRDVPDIAFPAAINEHAYLVCTVEAACTSGTTFGTNGGGGGLIGGTSAAAPNFAAMLAVVEQATGNTGGMGNINAKLYSLAAGSSASSVFHDITTGNNIVNCVGGTVGCSSTASSILGTMGYSAGVGYDMVTGLGSLDANGLVTALQQSSPTSKLTPTVSLAAATTTPVGGATDILTFSVSGSGSSPSGSVTLTIDGVSVSTVTVGSAVSTYTYTAPSCSTSSGCTHTAVATYTGDSNYASATSSLTLTVPYTVKLTPTINLTAATTTPVLGATDVFTVRVSGSGATPTGTVTISVDGTTAGTVTLASGTGTFSYTATCSGSATGCTHTVVAAYGSDNFYNAATSASVTLTVGTITKVTPTVNLTPATLTPAAGSTDVLTVTVAGTGGTPTGTVNLTIDGVASAGSITLASGTGSYSYTVPSCSTVCTHTVIANYTGDASFNSASTASVTLTVGSAISIAPGSTALTVKSGSSVTNAINITSSGFAGTVAFQAVASPSLAGCYVMSPGSVPVTAGGTGTSTMTIYTSSANCTSTSATPVKQLAANHALPSPLGRIPRGGLAILAAGLVGVFTLRRRRPTALLVVLVSAALAIGLSGCGNSPSAATVTTASTGGYTITVTATGTPTSGSTTVTATTTFTLTVD